MKDLLNNPWVVGALCIAAVITVYLRLFDTKSSPSVPAHPVEQPVAVAPPAPPPPVATVVTVPPGEQSLSQVPIVGKWIEKITRDPFQRIGEDGREISAGIRPGLSPGNLEMEGNQQLLRPDQPLRLQAIFVNGSKRIAVINSMFVKVGDEVGGFRVSQIKADGVWLQGGTEKHWVEFGQGRNREPVS